MSYGTLWVGSVPCDVHSLRFTNGRLMVDAHVSGPAVGSKAPLVVDSGAPRRLVGLDGLQVVSEPGEVSGQRVELWSPGDTLTFTWAVQLLTVEGPRPE